MQITAPPIASVVQPVQKVAAKAMDTYCSGRAEAFWRSSRCSRTMPGILEKFHRPRIYNLVLADATGRSFPHQILIDFIDRCSV